MNRLAACIVVLLLAAACADENTSSAASLPGPNSLVVSGRFLFIANTGSSELRVLNLEPDTRRFVRAPNPLFPLSVPTPTYARTLAGHVGADGTGSAYSFALSPASARITVVSNARLAALGSIPAPDTSLGIAVTAPTSGVRLVIAATQGGYGALWTASFGADLDADSKSLEKIVPAQALALGTSVPQVLAASPVDPDLVAVGDRLDGDDGLGRRGGLAICSLKDGSVRRLEVGGPVGALSFDPSGRWLVGVLDSAACGLSRRCVGFFSVDLQDPKSPVLVGTSDVPGVAQGVAAAGAIDLTFSDERVVTVNPLVMVSSTNGTVYLFDGATGRAVDQSEEQPSATVEDIITPPCTDKEREDGLRRCDPIQNPLGGPTQMELAPNSPSQAVEVRWQGVLLRGVAGTASAGGLSDSFDFVQAGVLPGDSVVFTSTGSCSETKAKVSGVAKGRLTLEGLSAGCEPSLVAYEVRAPEYAVTGSRTGFLGRVGQGGAFVGGGLRFALGTPAGTPDYRISVDSGLKYFSVSLLASTTSALYMPGAVTFDPKNGLFYVAYTGGNALVEYDPVAMRSGSTTSGIAAYY